MSKQKPGWRDIPEGGLIINPGSAEEYKTGDWRNKRPVFDADKCIQCMLCWIYCPDNAINLDEGKVIGIDYDHCKGCGICVVECPDRAAALSLEDEHKKNEETE